MKTLFFLPLLSCIALQAEYVAEIQLTNGQNEVVMNSTMIVDNGQPVAMTVGEEGASTTIELRVTAD